MNILSLFGGMDTGRVALENLGYKIEKSYYSEIKPHAIKLTLHHHPDTISLGDINDWENWEIDWANIDIIFSGSPCQDLSIAGKRAGIHGSRSSLFFVFVYILNYVKKLNTLSLFAGMGTLELALKNLGFEIGKSYASEVKPYAIKLMQHHFPDTIQLGDINNWEQWNIDWASIDLIGSGSPC